MTPSSVTYLKRLVLKIRSAREAARLGQNELSEKLNIGLRTYQRIESGEVAPDYNFLLSFSLVLGISFNELVSPYPPEPRNIVLFESLDDQKKFESMDFVIESQFLYWLSLFENKLFELGATDEFKIHERPLILWSQSKTLVNEAHFSFFQKRKWRMGIPIPLTPAESINAIDCLTQFRPKYSIVKVTDEDREMEVYSAHLHRENELLTFSVLKINL